MEERKLRKKRQRAASYNLPAKKSRKRNGLELSMQALDLQDRAVPRKNIFTQIGNPSLKIDAIRLSQLEAQMQRLQMDRLSQREKIMKSRRLGSLLIDGKPLEWSSVAELTEEQLQQLEEQLSSESAGSDSNHEDYYMNDYPSSLSSEASEREGDYEGELFSLESD